MNCCSGKNESTWERLRSTSPETPPTKITRLTSPLSLSSSSPYSPGAKSRHKIREVAKQTGITSVDGMDNKPVLNDDPSVTLTIRLIMQGKVSTFSLNTDNNINKHLRGVASFSNHPFSIQPLRLSYIIIEYWRLYHLYSDVALHCKISPRLHEQEPFSTGL